MARPKDDDFDVHHSATVKSNLLNKAFQEGFNEAQASIGLTFVVKVVLKFEGHLMNQREFTGDDFVWSIKQALEWAGGHLTHGPDSEAIISVEHVMDVPGTEIVEAELVEED